jgi:hypothetical protein
MIPAAAAARRRTINFVAPCVTMGLSSSAMIGGGRGGTPPMTAFLALHGHDGWALFLAPEYKKSSAVLAPENRKQSNFAR